MKQKIYNCDSLGCAGQEWLDIDGGEPEDVKRLKIELGTNTMHVEFYGDLCLLCREKIKDAIIEIIGGMGSSFVCTNPKTKP